ncbi:hypothetical protein DL96DRAFT_1710746 [Flagelloscypha sp. PMI_526]|nr:hypothetical protein DL96DRAFT_1710746 [Flagelloscypha sp. PMI_526]
MSFSQVPTDTDLLNEARSNPELVQMFRAALFKNYQRAFIVRELNGRDVLQDSVVFEVFSEELVVWMKRERAAAASQPGLPVAPASNPILPFPPLHGPPSTYQPLQACPLPIQAFNVAPSSLNTRHVNAQRTGRFTSRSVSDTAAQSAGTYHQQRGQRMPFNGNQRQQQPSIAPVKEVIAVILPLRYVENPGSHAGSQEQDTPVNYKYPTSEFGEVYDHLEKAGLTVPILVPSTGSIPHVDILQSVTVALVEAGFEIPGHPDFKAPENVTFPSTLPFCSTWYKIVKANKKGGSGFASVVADGVVPADFEYSHIKKTYPSNPSDYGPDRLPLPPLLLLAPHAGNLRRSLDGLASGRTVPRHDEPHACYGHHLLNPLQILRGPAFEDDDITCEKSCPKTAGVERLALRPSTPPIVIGRPRSHPSPRTARVVRARTGPSPERQNPHPIPPLPSSSIQPFAPVIQGNALQLNLFKWPDTAPTLATLPLPGRMDSFIQDVQFKVVPAAGNSITVLQMKDIEISIHGILEYYAENNTLEGHTLPAGARQNNAPMVIQNLFERYSYFTVSGTGIFTAGSSPTLHVMTRLLEKLTSDPSLWRNCTNDSRYKVPVLGHIRGPQAPGLRERLKEAGMLAAIIIGRYGMAPLPISPFLILMLASRIQDEVFSLPHAYVALLDPAIFTAMANILCWKFGEERPRGYGHPINQFIIEVLDEVPDNKATVISDESEYEHLIRISWSRALFGYDDPFDHPNFTAIRDGFYLTLDPSRSQPDCSIPEMLRRDEYSLSFHQKILYMYNQIPNDISTVLPKLKCRPGTKSETVFLYAALLELRLRQYLLGVGHPKALKEVFEFTEEVMERARNDSSLRWRMLMVAATGSPQMPPAAHWELKFRVYAATDEANKENEPDAIHWHACFGSADVFLTWSMKKMLVEHQTSAGEDASDRTFDRWLHSQLWMDADESPFFNKG